MRERGSDRLEGEHRELRRDLAGHGIPYPFQALIIKKYNMLHRRPDTSGMKHSLVREICIYQKRVREGSGDIKRSHKHAELTQIKMDFFGLKPEGRQTNTLMYPSYCVFCYSLHTHLATHWLYTCSRWARFPVPLQYHSQQTVGCCR